jgi:hypothetical protein
MKTAVEWLQEALMTSENAPNYNQWAFNKAKEMEKEQMIELWNMAVTCESFEQYYNETFKSKSYQQKMRDKVDYYKNKFKSE